MNRENLLKFVEALETTELPQCRFAYRNADDAYCAEGVGMRLAGVYPWLAGWRAASEQSAYRQFYDWLGMPDGTPLRVKHNGGRFDIAGLNDDAELSFREIAQLIREQYLCDEDCGMAPDADWSVADG